MRLKVCQSAHASEVPSSLPMPVKYPRYESAHASEVPSIRLGLGADPFVCWERMHSSGILDPAAATPRARLGCPFQSDSGAGCGSSSG